MWTVRGHRAHRGTDFKKSTWVWEGWPGYSTSSSSCSCGWSWSSCRTPPSCCQDGNTTCEQSGGKVQDRSFLFQDFTLGEFLSFLYWCLCGSVLPQQWVCRSECFVVFLSRSCRFCVLFSRTVLKEDDLCLCNVSRVLTVRSRSWRLVCVSADWNWLHNVSRHGMSSSSSSCKQMFPLWTETLQTCDHQLWGILMAGKCIIRAFFSACGLGSLKY